MKYWKGLVRFGKDEGPPSQGNEMHVNEMRYGHRVAYPNNPRQATRGRVHAIVLKMRCRLQRTAGLGGWSDERTIFLVALNAVWLAVALSAPFLRAQRQETGLIIQSWKYDPETKGLALKLVNSSGKDIIAYNISDSDEFQRLLWAPESSG